MNWKLLFNPFEKIPEKTLIIIGIVTLIIGSLLSFQFKVIFDGIFDIHEYPPILFSQAFTANAVNIIVLSFILFVLGKIFNPKTRMIDIMNTAFISRIPLYFLAPMTALPPVREATNNIMANIQDIQNMQIPTSDLVTLFAFSSVTLLFLVYSIVLIVTGFKTATNIKKWQQYAGFAAALLVAEIISKLLISII
ncbi:MAG: YIP1 family protein [Bergeyella sp.]